MDKKGLKKWIDFEKEIGMRGATTRWRKGKNLPTPETLLIIKEKFDVLIDWLLTGEEFIPTSDELTAEPYEPRSLNPMEADLLNAVTIKVEEVLKAEKQILQTEQKARLLTRIYNDCAEDRIQPDHTMVKRYLWVLK